jgi:hypothetical protein
MKTVRTMILILMTVALQLSFETEMPTASAEGACPALDCSDSTVSPTATGFKYAFSGDTFYKVPIEIPGSINGVQYDYFYQVDCPNVPPATVDGDVGDTVCNQDGTDCAKANGLLLLVWYRRAGTRDQPVASPTPICSTGQVTITLPQLEIAVDERATDYLKSQDLDQPAISVQPATTALVNLPTILSVTPDSGQLEMPVTEPIAGTLDLVPTYSWDFGDNTTQTPTVAGIAYDGTDPQTDPDHYPVLHTFHNAASYTVQATVTWTATTLHLAGLGDFPVNKTHAFPATANVTTHEARAVLVTGR